MTGITRVSTFKGTTGNGAKLQALIQGWLPEILAADGCNSMVLHRDPSNPDNVVAVEDWDSAQQHETFFQAP